MGQKRRPEPIPVQTPWARNNCQYLVDREVIKTPRSCRIVPAINVGRKYPASVARPDRVPMKKRRKICTEPTQEISDGEWPSCLT